MCEFLTKVLMKLKSSGMWHRFVYWCVTNVSETKAATVFRCHKAQEYRLRKYWKWRQHAVSKGWKMLPIDTALYLWGIGFQALRNLRIFVTWNGLAYLIRRAVSWLSSFSASFQWFLLLVKFSCRRFGYPAFRRKTLLLSSFFRSLIMVGASWG